jgi:molecular chaperone GrpE (heat shock protein)
VGPEHKDKVIGVDEPELRNVAPASEETSLGRGSLNPVQPDDDRAVPPSEGDTRLTVTDGEYTEERSTIEGILRELTNNVQGLRDDFRRSAQTYDHQRVLLDKLHGENERLRRAELERAGDPVVRDLISLSDTCLRNGRTWLQRADVTPGDIYRVLRDVTDDMKLILERQGVETFEPEAGAKFDRREDRVVRSASTADASLDGVIAEVLKPGYRMGNRILRYCEVVVWAYVAGSAADPVDAF